MIADTSGAQPRREILRTSTSSLYATLLKASTMPPALLNTPQPTQGCAESVINPGTAERNVVPVPLPMGAEVGTSRNAAYFDWEQSGLIRRHDATKDIAPNPNQWAPTVSIRKVPTARVRTCPRFDRSHDPEVPR